jgi:hypothetical protein
MLRATARAALSLLAALVAACGSGAADGGADPASLVPTNAMVYVDVTIRPEGDVREEALAAAGKALRSSDPESQIRRVIDKALAEDNDDLDYAKDIKPWLGQHVGFWFGTRLDRDGDPGGAALIATTDPDAALDAFHKSSAADKLTKRSYHGTDYEVDKDGVATGIVEDFLVTGPEPEFKQVVDAPDGKALADADGYRKNVDQLNDDRLAHFYVDLGRALELAQKSNPEDEQLRQLQSMVPLGKLPPVVGSFSADGDRLAVDVALKADAVNAFGSFGGLGGSTPLLKDLPGDSWAAFGAPEYGKSLNAMLNQYAGMFGGAAARQQLQQQYGIDLDQDILSWIGDVAAFARGDSLATLDGGVVIQVTDAGKSATGFGKIVGLLQAAGGTHVDPISIKGAANAFAITDNSTPKPIVAARNDKKVVIAYGREAAEQAFSPSSKFGDSDVYGRAKALLGDVDPSLVLSMPAVLGLVDSIGEADAGYAHAKPYLEAYDAIALGYDGDKDGGRVRFVAGFK